MYQPWKTTAFGILLLAGFVMSACQPTTQIPGEPSQDATSQPTKQVVVPDLTATIPSADDTEKSEEEEMSAEPDPSKTPIPPGLTPLVDKAVNDLASRLNVDPQTIEVISAEAVTWPDGALGCPQPGMMYTQVLVDGAKIVLRANEVLYNYHSGGGRDPFLCEKLPSGKQPSRIDLTLPPAEDLDK